MSIPVIASVNCTYSHEWASFAKDIEAAGADGLELNMFFLPSDIARSSDEREKDVPPGRGTRPEAGADPRGAEDQLLVFHPGPDDRHAFRRTGIAALVLFNRFYSIDFDIEKMAVTGSSSLSSPAEIAGPLRWVALMSRRVGCDIAASTGVHDGAGLIKMLLAGRKRGAGGLGVLQERRRQRRGHAARALSVDGQARVQDARTTSGAGSARRKA